jgi:hypothetical protein
MQAKKIYSSDFVSLETPKLSSSHKPLKIKGLRSGSSLSAAIDFRVYFFRSVLNSWVYANVGSRI